MKALDVRLTHCYLIMMQNPEGCFTNSKGVQLKSEEAIEKLDRMAESLGLLIDKEDELLRGVTKALTQGKKQ